MSTPERPRFKSIFGEGDLLGGMLREAPLDFRLLGKTLLHAAIVGLAAGLLGVAFFVGLEILQRHLLEGLAGYEPLRANGERGGLVAPASYRPIVLLFLPAIGALLSGLIAWKIAPEVSGGGGDAMIGAFHHREGRIRPRVIWAKALASLATLGTGGSGGREGPTMQIGGAVGSLIADVLRVGPRERRVLLIAGVAAGISAVFRTPLGAALLAVEVLYRDDFEAEALVPAVLASVVGYSVVISILGESTLFAHSARYPFVPRHLPLYALLAVTVAICAAGFLGTLRAVERVADRSRVPPWIRPAVGGLLLGAAYITLRWFYSEGLPEPGQGLGILGGSYGAAQIAITGADWLPSGWAAVELLAVLALCKLVATSLTIGTGGSAGDFAPSLVIGGLVGGAFGRAVSLLLDDPTIDPGAFALVGMGAFYGGIANVPLAALVLVCELAGSYDLLVPLMLAEGIAIVALRHRSLYRAQVPARRDSPAHVDGRVLDRLRDRRVESVLTSHRPFVSFDRASRAEDLVRRSAEQEWQDIYPVLEDGRLIGVVTAESIRLLAAQPDAAPLVVAADLMRPPLAVRATADLRETALLMLENGLRELPVTDTDGRVVGFVDEADIARLFLTPAADRESST